MMFILGGSFRFLYSLKFLTFSVCLYDFDILHARKMSELNLMFHSQLIHKTMILLLTNIYIQ